MRFATLKLEKLQESNVNPRLDLMTEETASLAQSIKTYGILQPLVVSETKGKFTIIAGHRRATAAAVAGLAEVPCIVRSRVGKSEVAHLVENVQRVDLTPAETGMAVHGALSGARKIKQLNLAEQLGRSEGWVSKHKTIGQAVERGNRQRAEYLDLLETANADTAYDLALILLGRGSTEKKKQKDNAAPKLVPLTLEELIEVQANENAAPYEVSINQDGPKGKVVVQLRFDDDATARRFFKR
jgi:ParB/RepB/Spo0J family partition protein